MWSAKKLTDYCVSPVVVVYCKQINIQVTESVQGGRFGLEKFMDVHVTV